MTTDPSREGVVDARSQDEAQDPPPGDDGPGHASDLPAGLVVTPDGERVFVTGASIGAENGVAGYDVATLACAPEDGSSAWTTRFGAGPGVADFPATLALNTAGTDLFVFGNSQTTAMHGDYQTLRYDAASGAHEWFARHKGVTQNVATAMAVGPTDDRIFVTGYTWVSGARSKDWVTAAYQPTV